MRYRGRRSWRSQELKRVSEIPREAELEVSGTEKSVWDTAGGGVGGLRSSKSIKDTAESWSCGLRRKKVFARYRWELKLRSQEQKKHEKIPLRAEVEVSGAEKCLQDTAESWSCGLRGRKSMKDTAESWSGGLRREKCLEDTAENKWRGLWEKMRLRDTADESTGTNKQEQINRNK